MANQAVLKSKELTSTLPFLTLSDFHEVSRAAGPKGQLSLTRLPLGNNWQKKLTSRRHHLLIQSRDRTALGLFDRLDVVRQRCLGRGMSEDLLGGSHRFSHLTQCRSHRTAEYTPSRVRQIERLEGSDATGGRGRGGAGSGGCSGKRMGRGRVGACEEADIEEDIYADITTFAIL
jgi:hypothetical protein